MQVILTEQEYNSLKTSHSEEIENIKYRLFDNNVKFLKEMVEYCKTNYSHENFESGTFGKGAELIIEKYKI